jgi:hypothetical protein
MQVTGQTDLSQSGLQIEAGVCGLFRFDRPVHAQNFPPEHVIRPTID